VSAELAGVHYDIDNILGSLPGALNAYADELESAQKQIARAEQMRHDASDVYSSSMASLPDAPAHAGPAAQEHYRTSLDSINTAYQQQSTAAGYVASSALGQHQAAVIRLTAHIQRVADEGAGAEATLTKIGDALGVPVAVLSALSTIALLRAAGRLATVGSSFAASAAVESDDLSRFLATALIRQDITVDEAVDRLVSFVDHTELASQMFTNAAKADVGAGGLLDLGRVTGAAKWAGRGAGVLAIVGDAYTFWHPDEGGAWGEAEQGMAVVNGVGTTGLLAVDGFGLAEAGGVLGAEAALSWVPVAGQVLVIGTGLYLMGNYLYAHAQWFHDGIDAVGHGLAVAGASVGRGAVAAGHAVGAGLDDASQAVGTGWNDASHAVGTGLRDTGQALGSAAHSVAGFFGL
jgi:hypothetical protein